MPTELIYSSSYLPTLCIHTYNFVYHLVKKHTDVVYHLVVVYNPLILRHAAACSTLKASTLMFLPCAQLMRLHCTAISAGRLLNGVFLLLICREGHLSPACDLRCLAKAIHCYERHQQLARHCEEGRCSGLLSLILCLRSPFP